MNGFNISSASDVYYGGNLVKWVYIGNKKVWDYKTPPVYTAPTAKAGLIYNGSAQALLNAGSTSHGTIQYSSDGSTWGTSIPTSTNASNAITVYWRLVGDGRHNDVGPTEITASISKKDLTITAKAQTITYGNSIATGTGQVTTSGLVSGDSLTGVSLITSTSNVTTTGTITPRATTAKGIANYSVTYATGTLTITARPINITAGSTSKTYDGTALSYNSATAEATGTNRGLVSGHSITSCTVTGTITNAGSANNVPSAAVIKSGSTDVTSNYAINYVNGTLTINARAVTSTAANEVITYDGDMHSASNTGNTTNLPSGHTATYSCYSTVISVVSDGSATKYLQNVVIKNSSNVDVTSNFTITKVNGTISIAKRPITITAKPQTINYCGTISPGTGQVNVTSGSIAHGDYFDDISLSQSTSNVGTGTITPSNASILYDDGVRIENREDNYNITYVTGTLTVQKGSPTISLGGTGSKVYDGRPLYATATVTYNGGITPKGTLYYGTSKGASTYSVVYNGSAVNLTSVSQTNVGRVTVYATFVPDSSCSSVYNTREWPFGKKLTITAKALTITAKAQTITYGQSIATGVGQVTTSGLVSGDRLTSITLTASRSTVGTGTITPSAGATTKGIGNYSVTYKTGTLTIVAANGGTLRTDGIYGDIELPDDWEANYEDVEITGTDEYIALECDLSDGGYGHFGNTIVGAYVYSYNSSGQRLGLTIVDTYGISQSSVDWDDTNNQYTVSGMVSSGSNVCGIIVEQEDTHNQLELHFQYID